jgi:hypothetical protein
MTRADFIAFERHIAAAYRREARSRRKRYPALAEQLDRWAEAADRRIEAVRCGPLFGVGGEA